jgi:hypothetical protein
VGNHKIAGTVEKLSKPVIVVAKAEEEVVPPSRAGAGAGAGASSSSSSADADGDVGLDDAGEEAQQAGYVVKAVVRYKLMFTERPQPVISGGPAGPASGGAAAATAAAAAATAAAAAAKPR